uniref:Uncharacterized protein n=1 Tax=Meloidogyne incognita TaxID=6306 RepID=A0A914N7N5_MELIC
MMSGGWKIDKNSFERKRGVRKGYYTFLFLFLNGTENAIFFKIPSRRLLSIKADGEE